MRPTVVPMLSPRGRAGATWIDPTIAAGLVVLALTVYVRTLYPGLSLHGDTPKFQYLGSVLGTAHPPGYPLYILLSYVFSKLPIGSMAFRMNLFSAVGAAAAVGLTYLALVRLECHRVVAVAAALSLAFGRLFWGRALQAEVYGLAAALMALVLFLVVRWAATGRDRDLYLTIFVFGLSLSNHLVLAAVAPALVIFVLMTRPASIRWRTILIGAAVGIAGFLPYLYIVIRSLQHSPYLEAQATTVPELVDVILARHFSGYMFSFTTHEILSDNLPLVWTMAVTELGVIGMSLAGLGLAVAAVRHRTVAVLLATAVAGLVFLTVEVFAETDGFLMPAWVPMWMLAALGMQAVLSAARAMGRAPAALAGVALLIMPAVALGRGYRPSDHHQFTDDTKYFAALFRQLPDRAVIVSDYYTLDQAIKYKIIADHAALGRTIEPVANDRAVVGRYAKAGYAVFAFSKGMASLSSFGFEFEPVQLYEAGAIDGRPAAMTPIDMGVRPLFRMARRVPCDAVGNNGWQDVTEAAADGQLVIRVDNYRSFDSSVIVYAGMRDSGAEPALVASTGPRRPSFAVETFRTDRPDEKARLAAAIGRDGAAEAARLLAQPIVRRLEWRVNDQGDFSQFAVAVNGRPEVAVARASVDRDNPLRATVCGWAGDWFFATRTHEAVSIAEGEDRLFGQGWSGAEAMSAGGMMRHVTSEEAELIVPLARIGRIVVRVRASPSEAATPGQPALALVVNGESLAARTMTSGWQDYEWDVPAARWRTGLNRLTLVGRGGTVSVSGLTFDIASDRQADRHVR